MKEKKQYNLSLNYLSFFKQEWSDITFKLRLFSQVVDKIKLTPPRGTEEYEYYKKTKRN